jgi:hypothetical protein
MLLTASIILSLFTLVNHGKGCVEAQLSGSCLTETNALSADTKLGEYAYNIPAAPPTCDVHVCDLRVDAVEEISSTQTYIDRCYELDGQLYYFNYSFSCPTMYQFTVTDTYNYQRVPQCIGKSCTVNDFIPYVKDQFVTVPSVKSAVASRNCTIDPQLYFYDTLSGSCAAETRVLSSDATLIWPDFTIPNISGTTLDFLETTETYKQACLQINGTLFTVAEVAVKCNSFENNFVSTYTTTFLNDVYCFGAKCKVSDVEGYIKVLNDPWYATYIQDSDKRYSSCVVTSGVASKGTSSTSSAITTSHSAPSRSLSKGIHELVVNLAAIALLLLAFQ